MSKNFYAGVTLIAGIRFCMAVNLVCADEVSSNQVTRLPEVQVIKKQLQEETPLGPYQQPGWTTHRRFSTTRVYVQQPLWGIEFEQWWRGRFKRGGDYEHLFQEELSFGLPHRLQVDLYENWVAKSGQSARHHDFAVEFRWALADWGRIPLNPTLYGEWKFVDGTQGPDVYELKLLLGEELAPRWHWGLNGVYEQEIGGGRTTEWAVSQAVSYTLIDEKLSAGVEMKFVHESEDGSRSAPEIKFLIGPSVQWRPTRNSHLDFVPLFGVTGDSPHMEAYVVFGFDFGPGNERGIAPKSLQSQ